MNLLSLKGLCFRGGKTPGIASARVPYKAKIWLTWVVGLLVLGGSGLVGRSLRRSLLGEHSPCHWPSRNDLDLSDHEFCRRLPDGVTKIVFLAQGPRRAHSAGDYQEMLMVNSVAPLLLLNHYSDRGLEHFVYASTGNVYWATIQQTSATLLCDADPYSASKLSAEHFLFRSTPSPVNLAVLRLFTVYGGSVDDSGLVGTLRRKLQTSEPVALRGFDGDYFQPTHVSDVVQVIRAVLKIEWTGVADVFGPEELSVREMTDRLCNLTGATPRYHLVDEAPQRFTAPEVRRLATRPFDDPNRTFPGEISCG